MRFLSKTATGPLGWIKEGTLDISLSITLPPRECSTKYREQESTPTKNSALITMTDNDNESIEENDILEEVKKGEVVEMRFDVMFNHLHVSAPLYTPELSYINNAVVHPILAYMNSHSKHIPLSFEVALNMDSLAGARSPGEAGLWDSMSASVATEFGRIVHDSQTTETLRSVANTLLKDCWGWLAGWVYSPTYLPAH